MYIFVVATFIRTSLAVGHHVISPFARKPTHIAAKVILVALTRRQVVDGVGMTFASWW
jgi:hypothetical protein